MAEKMYGFTHLISETKLLALIASNADEVKVDIFTPERRNGTKRVQNSNGRAPLLLEHKEAAPSGAGEDLAAQWGARKWGGRQVILKTLYDNPDCAVTNAELATEAAKFGVSAQSISVAMTPLVASGMVERVSAGRFKILEPGIEYVAERTFSPPTAPTAPAPQPTNQKPGITAAGCAMIWDKMADGARHERLPFMKMFEQAGLPHYAVGACFAEMTKKGYLNKVGRGLYQMSAKGKKFAQQRQPRHDQHDQHDQHEGQENG